MDARAKLARLSDREREIVEMVAQEMSNPAIAAELFLSESMVKQHLTSAATKLGVTGRVGIAMVLARAE